MGASDASKKLLEAGLESTSAQRRKRWLYLTLVLLLCFCLYLPGLKRPVGFFHDDGIYIVTGRALAQGQGYRIISIPGSPRQTKYPPLYPALLAVLWRLAPAFPANTVWFRFANIFFWLAALALTYDLLVRFRYTTPGIALLIIAWRGLSPDAANATSVVISEALVTLLIAGCLWFCEACMAATTQRQAAGFAALSGLFLGLSILTRSSVIFLGIALGWALWRKYRMGIVAVSVTALPAYAGWALRARLPSRLPGWDLRSYYLDYVGWVLHQYSLIPLPLVFAANLFHLITFALPAQVLPFDPHGIIANELPHGFNWFVAVVGVGITCLVIRGGVTLWSQGRTLLPLSLLALTIPVCCWPADIGRYIVPAGMICLALAGIGWQQSRHQFKRYAKTLTILTLGLAFLSLSITSYIYAIGFRSGSRSSWDPVIAWVRRNVPPGQAVCSEIDPILYLQTGRQGISDRCWMSLNWNRITVAWNGRDGYCPHANFQREQLRLMNVRWFIDAGAPDAPRSWGHPNIVHAHPEWFTLVYTSGRSGFSVYRPN